MSAASLLVLSAALSATPDGVLLDFTAPWCGPCQQMNPIVSRLERAGLPVRKVDVDKERALAQRCGVKNIPCFVLIVGGKIVDRRVGATSETELRNMIARIPMRDDTQLAFADSPQSAPAKAAEPETPRAAKNESKPRFQFPFFGRNDESKSLATDAAEQLAQADEAPIIRAKFDRRDDLQPTSAIVDPLASSVRILVRDDRGINFGSGTIIDSRPGRAVILTCGHIFRDLRKDSSIEVDVRAGERSEKYIGQVLNYDLQADVGLLAIPAEAALAVSPVAPLGRVTQPGQSVYSIGCGGGEPPSRLDIQITALNRYLGPDNIECTGVPQQGRSGGGLFDQQGEVIGVCFAANPEDERGLYAGLKPIHALLDEAQLSHVYRRTELDQPAAPPADALAQREPPTHSKHLATTSGTESNLGGGASSLVRSPESEIRSQNLTTENGQRATDNRQIEELRTILERSGEAEVVCIIRPLDDPQAASRVVIINRASPKFVSYLTGELERQPQPTSGTIRFDDESPQPRASSAAAPERYRRQTPAAEELVEQYQRSPESR